MELNFFFFNFCIYWLKTSKHIFISQLFLIFSYIQFITDFNDMLYYIIIFSISFILTFYLIYFKQQNKPVNRKVFNVTLEVIS